MKKTKKMLGILLACLMLMSMLTVGVFAEGTQENPIDANAKWFGYGVDCFLLNTTIEAGDTDGVWYKLVADAAGILQLEHSTPSDQYSTNEDGESIPVPNLEYQITATVNGKEYLAFENGIYNRPITTYPVAVGDIISIHVIAQDTALGGTVYLNAKFISGDKDATIKVKSAPSKLYVAAGATIYYQDDSLNADYATRCVTLSGDSVADVTLYAAGANAAGNIVKQATYTDTDGDNVIEGRLGGSEGSAGAPPVKPNWIITNNSNEDRCFILSVVDEAHECAGLYSCSATCATCDKDIPQGEHTYDDNTDADCNNCGEVRELPCQHQYTYDCDSVCSLCGKETRPEASHEYFYACDGWCMICNEFTNPEAAHSMVYTEAKEATCTENGNIAYYSCEHCGGCWDNQQAMGMPLNRFMIVIPAAHSYDDDMDAACNGCGEVRLIEYSIVSSAGISNSEAVTGVAFKFNANVSGITTSKKYVADYSCATVNTTSLSGALKLVSLGAVVSTDNGITYREYADGRYTADVTAEKVFDVTEDTVSYAIRIINIPENQYTTTIAVRPYFIYEDAQGEQVVVYGEEQTACYADGLTAN